jgi:hypothetical protein
MHETGFQQGIILQGVKFSDQPHVNMTVLLSRLLAI